MSGDNMFYELVIRSNGRRSFVPDDLRYFNDHFVTERMKPKWTLPPAEEIGKRHRAADFVLWMQRAPILSGRAVDALSPLCDSIAEFLPFHTINARPYYAMNVISLDNRDAVFKRARDSVVFVSEEVGEIIRDRMLSGVELADPNTDVDRRVARGECVNAFPGLVG